MLYRPSDLSPERADAFESHAQELRERVLAHVETLLSDVESPQLAQSIYDLAFSGNDVLPKRRNRPKLESALLAEQVYLAFDPDGAELEPILQLTIVVQEYYDILDDVIDDDVAPGHENEAVLVSQALVPIIVRVVHRLGDDAVDYWSREVFELLEAPRVEADGEHSLAQYERLVDRQATLFGFVTGLCAVVTDQTEDDIERAEAIGTAVYKHAQFVLDYEQFERGDDESWNVRLFESEDDVVARLRSLRDDVETRTAPFPEEQAQLLNALVALDVETWQTRLSAKVRDGESERASEK